MSEYLSNRDGGKTSEHGLVRFVSNLVSGNTIGTAWQVTQRGAGANMSVDVAAGTGKIDTGSGYAYEAWSDAAKNVAITTADATNPRRDIIVAYIDKSVVSSASSDNPGALKFIAVAGTPAGSPSDPSGSTIQSAVGAGNPYAQIARVSVAASASSITNAVIADLRTAVTVNANIGGSDGWNSLGYTPSTVTANGNRSYSLVFTGVDLTPTLAPAMRLKTTRTVTAPTQSTSLNGTTQYYSKSSPAGMTFTNNYTVSAWVKLSSYAGANMMISSRFNGTNGWEFYINSTGQVNLIGHNAAAANYKLVQSNQSIPLNKWVHIAAQQDMTSATNSPTVNYVMINGVDVPAVVSSGGTAPTALIQAGNLEIGSSNAGASPLPGKIAQIAIYSTKVTQANVLATISQGLAGTETSLISAYTFNNSINDLNANANNLTANGSAVATNADSPFSINSFGTATGTTDFAIIMSSTFSTNTTLVVQVPEGCTIPTSGGVSAVSYGIGTPYGFPKQEDKWYIKALWLSSDASATTSTTFVQLGSRQINVPIGAWVVGYMIGLTANSGGGNGDKSVIAGLSTLSATTVDDSELLSYVQWYVTGLSGATVGKFNNKTLSVATTYYMLYRSPDAIQAIAGRGGADVFYAKCAYL